MLVACAVTCRKQDEKRTPRPAVTRAAKREPRPIPLEPPFAAHELEVADSGFPCDVEAALKAKCRRCHTLPARHGAPFPLLTWQQTQQAFRGTPIAGHMGRAVKSGFMPYRINANPPIEPLTESEKQAIIAWVEAGAEQTPCKPELRATTPTGNYLK
jgi:hypothetical protein